uniref:Uncharacterized protein n=1 Tax=Romanomermis culicivorax TaxID=13658 RepID=A0A915J3D6_ROMCU
MQRILIDFIRLKKGSNDSLQQSKNSDDEIAHASENSDNTVFDEKITDNISIEEADLDEVQPDKDESAKLLGNKKIYGFNQKWLKDFPWLRLVSKNERQIYCDICGSKNVASQWASRKTKRMKNAAEVAKTKAGKDVILFMRKTKDLVNFTQLKAIVEQHLSILEDLYTSGQFTNGPMAAKLLRGTMNNNGEMLTGKYAALCTQELIRTSTIREETCNHVQVEVITQHIESKP